MNIISLEMQFFKKKNKSLITERLRVFSVENHCVDRFLQSPGVFRFRKRSKDGQPMQPTRYQFRQRFFQLFAKNMKKFNFFFR